MLKNNLINTKGRDFCTVTMRHAETLFCFIDYSVRPAKINFSIKVLTKHTLRHWLSAAAIHLALPAD